jgi:hypothetical protein
LVERKRLQVEVRGRDPSKGSFGFDLALRREPSGLLRFGIETIRVLEDGSGGSTRWGFNVWVRGRVVLTVPEASYDDRIRVYRLSRQPPIEAVLNPENAGYLEFTIIATKPSSETARESRLHF